MTDQNTQFMAILTAVGEAKQANANALGIPWIITQMGVGDANGTEPTPDRLQTSLINERRRAPLNQLKVDPDNEAIIIAEQVIPENVGGWWIREIGLYDEDGDLVAVANCPPTFKPELSQGSGRTQVVRLNILVSSTENIQLKIDPSVVLATRSYVDSLTIRASKADAESGENDSKLMTPLRVIQALEAHVIGMGQIWHDVLDSRAWDTTYTNTTGRTIVVTAVARNASQGSAFIALDVDGKNIFTSRSETSGGNSYVSAWGIVPPGSTYIVRRGNQLTDSSALLIAFQELR